MRNGWTIYKETPDGWRRVSRLAWTFATACNIARAFETARGGRYCVNFCA